MTDTEFAQLRVDRATAYLQRKGIIDFRYDRDFGAMRVRHAERQAELAEKKERE